MKKVWKKPTLEILDVSMTMKHHGGGPKGPNPPDESEDVFGS